MSSGPLSGLLRAGTALTCFFACATAASAAPVLHDVGVDFGAAAYTFDLGGNSFIFTGTGDWFAPTAVSGTGAFTTIFGNPTSDFVDRGSPSFGASDQYGLFASPTKINYSNGDNFIGLRATVGDDVYYGFAYTTNSVLNSYGFESIAGQTIVPTTAAAAAVPETASWAMMLVGFGAMGASMRARRKTAVTLA